VSLLFRPSGILVSPTEAILFRTGGETQLIDEIDSHLNVGGSPQRSKRWLSKGRQCSRCEKVDGRSIPKSTAFMGRVFLPVNEQTLHETTRQRTFAIQMIPKRASDHVERFRPRQLASDIRRFVTRSTMGKSNRTSIASRYQTDTNLYYLDQFRDRTSMSPNRSQQSLRRHTRDPDLDAARAGYSRNRQGSKRDDYLAADRKHSRATSELARDNDPADRTATELAEHVDYLKGIPLP